MPDCPTSARLPAKKKVPRGAAWLTPRSLSPAAAVSPKLQAKRHARGGAAANCSGGSRMAEDVVDVSQLIDERRISGFQILVAVLCALAVFMDGFDTQMVRYVLPPIPKSLHIPPSALSPPLARGLGP